MIAPLAGNGALLSSLIRESVCDDHHKLDKFATVLQQFSSTAQYGTLIRKDYSKQCMMIKINIK